MVNFIIIGTQRGGTSSFYNDLLQHPQFVPAYHKDTRFFDSHYSKGVEWYRKQFPLLSEYSDENRPQDHITGEVSSHYMFHPLVAERVKKHFPEVKIIALLRNPTDRAYDHYRHAVKMGIEALSFPDALKVEAKRLERGMLNLQDNPFHDVKSSRLHGYISQGFYSRQIKVWYQYFDRSSFLFIKSEDYFKNPEPEILKAFEFLSMPVPGAIRTKTIDPNPYEALKSEMRRAVDNLYTESNRDLKQLIGWESPW